MTDDPFDLSKLALPPEMVRERLVSVPRKIRHGHFIRVPCWWAQRLSRARYAATFKIAHHLLYQHWKNRGRPVSLSNGAMKMEGVLRGAKWRGLRELEKAGLITIERRPRKSPVITVHVQPQT